MKLERIEETVAKLLLEKELKIAVAESCTGGMISCELTSVSGSSGYFERGFITYSNLAKVQMLGVNEATLNEHGAVSSQTAVEMAKGALSNSSANMALAVTGIAGPAGGTTQKPVGTVFIALATKDGKVDCQKYNFLGGRADIREQAANTALNIVALHLMSTQ